MENLINSLDYWWPSPETTNQTWVDAIPSLLGGYSDMLQDRQSLASDVLQQGSCPIATTSLASLVIIVTGCLGSASFGDDFCCFSIITDTTNITEFSGRSTTESIFGIIGDSNSQEVIITNPSVTSRKLWSVNEDVRLNIGKQAEGEIVTCNSIDDYTRTFVIFLTAMLSFVSFVANVGECIAEDPPNPPERPTTTTPPPNTTIFTIPPFFPPPPQPTDPPNTTPIPVPILPPIFPNDAPPDDGCGSSGIRYQQDGNCNELLERGPCGVLEWMVLNPDTGQGECVPQLCEAGRVFVVQTQLCHDVYDTNVCPQGRRLFYTAAAEAVCDCDDGSFQDPQTLECISYFEQGPCAPLEFYRISPNDSPVCEIDECAAFNSPSILTNRRQSKDLTIESSASVDRSSNSRQFQFGPFSGSTEGFNVGPSSGSSEDFGISSVIENLPFVMLEGTDQCFELGSQGPCKQGEILAFDLDLLEGVCAEIDVVYIILSPTEARLEMSRFPQGPYPPYTDWRAEYRPDGFITLTELQRNRRQLVIPLRGGSTTELLDGSVASTKLLIKCRSRRQRRDNRHKCRNVVVPRNRRGNRIPRPPTPPRLRCPRGMSLNRTGQCVSRDMALSDLPTRNLG